MRANPKQFVICAVGSGGDVLPFIHIAEELGKRGYAVTMFGPERYKLHAIMKAVRYRSIGSDDVFDEVFDGGDVWDPKKGTEASWRYYSAAMQSGFELIIKDFSPRNTVLISSTFAMAARLLQEFVAFENITVHLCPGVIFSRVEPPVWPSKSIPPSWPTWLKKFAANAAEKLGLDPLIGPMVNKVRSSINLPPVKRIFSEWIHSPTKVLYAFPEWYAKPASDWPQEGCFGDFPLAKRKFVPIDIKITKFITRNATNRIVVITGGTAVKSSNTWVEHAIAGARLSGFKVIHVSPNATVDEEVNSDYICVPFVPFEEVLPYVIGVIHHGGIGTLAEAIRSRRPQIAVPTAHDQFDNAKRLEQLGLGVHADSRWTEKDFSECINIQFTKERLMLLENHITKNAFKESGGVDKLCELILENASY